MTICQLEFRRRVLSELQEKNERGKQQESSAKGTDADAVGWGAVVCCPRASRPNWRRARARSKGPWDEEVMLFIADGGGGVKDQRRVGGIWFSVRCTQHAV